MYTVDYFLKFFGDIQEENWQCLAGTSKIGCALNHISGKSCGMYADCSIEGTPSYALCQMFRTWFVRNNINNRDDSNSSFVWLINDDEYNSIADGDTPKERILNVLRDIKKMNEEQNDKPSVATEDQSGLWADQTKKLTQLIPITEEKSDLKKVLASGTK